MTKSKEWITKNFESLVAKYGGKYIGVVNEHVISVALTPREVLENARKLGQEEEDVSLLKVPMEDEFGMKIGFSPKLGVGFNLLGMDVFDRYRIVFDNRAKKITFQTDQ
ncbi:MAG: hypothetical protein HF982_10920 [Desulfobacteraceae bacterium]|nr:hypothetical protein [Desulfobacteraceae bacterium]MBC2720077.1 hypothetical protein [Desulfobacteraceae bacterium]